MIDLHSHSTASDGALSPTALVERAAAAGLSALALTDHDTTDGLTEAAAAARRAGIRFIPGIEIEIAWTPPGVFHALGLGFDIESSALTLLRQEFGSARQRRNQAILDRMAAHGIDAELGEMSESDGVVTRPHFADFLVRRGIVKNRQQAFDQYLTPGKPFFEPYPGIDLARAAQAIHEAGGKLVVAHPLSLYVSVNRLGELMRDWRAAGVDGVEVWHPSASWKAAKRLEELAAAAGLGLSAGSDFHDPARPDRVLGRSLEEKHKIDDTFLAILG